MAVVATAAWGGLRVSHVAVEEYGVTWWVEIRDSEHAGGWNLLHEFSDWNSVRDWWHNCTGRDLGKQPKVN